VGARLAGTLIAFGLVACGATEAKHQHVSSAPPTVPSTIARTERPFWPRYAFQLPRQRDVLDGEERAERRFALEGISERRFAASNAIVRRLLRSHPNNIALHVIWQAGSSLSSSPIAFTRSELDVWDQAFDALDEGRFEEAFDMLERMARTRDPHVLFEAFHEVMRSRLAELALPHEPSRARRNAAPAPTRTTARPARLKETYKALAARADSEWLATNGFEWPSHDFRMQTQLLHQPRMVSRATDFKFGAISARVRGLTVSMHEWKDYRPLTDETIIFDDLWPSPGRRTLAWLDARDGKLFVLVDAEAPAREHGTLLKLDVTTKTVDWETKARACDSLNFAVDEELVWCGRALDLRSGAVVQFDRASGTAIATTRVEGTPRILTTRDDRLLVRTTSTDYVFEKTARGRSSVSM
jgi:hypothetical protein